MDQNYNLSDSIPVLKSICSEAGRLIMQFYDTKDLAVREKSDQSLVSLADIASHNFIVEHLKKTWPNCPIVSEEDASSLDFLNELGQFWLIDPLDGTKEFLSGSDEFTVNIALINRSRSILGVVYAPALNKLYWGGSGLGAYRVECDIEETIQVSPTSTNDVKRVLASKSHLNEDTQLFIDSLGKTKVVYAGSSLKFCKIAEGSADIYPRFAPTCQWDTAAAQAVLEGAGGVVVDLEMNRLTYGKSNILNPSFIALSSTEVL